MKKASTSQFCIYVGVLLLIAGLHLRSVESFVLTTDTTRVLANLTGPSADTAKGAVRQIVIDSAKPQKILTPPRWAGWACLSMGFVLTINGLLGRWRK
jgi:hypothetical protein